MKSFTHHKHLFSRVESVIPHLISGKSAIIVAFFFILTGRLYAQEPYHLVLGENELSAIDVYDINQTNDGVYWVATNNGVYSYDGYEFTKYEHEAVLSNAFFNLIKDYNDVVHFNNLNGQVFRVFNKKMELVHTIPDSLLSPYIGFNFLTNNDLVIRAKNTYKVDSSGLNPLFDLHNGYNINRDNKGNLLFQGANNELIVVSENGTSKIQLNYEDEKAAMDPVNLAILYHERGIFINVNGHSLFQVMMPTRNEFNSKNAFSAIDPDSRIHLTKDKIWVANNRFGVQMYNYPSAQRPVHPLSDLLFKQHYISQVFEDAKGNILLGTFGDGIIVIPKTGMENMEVGSALKISRIYSNESGGLYLGGFNGNVYDYSISSTKTLYNKGSKLIETIQFLPEQDLLLFDQRTPLLLNIKTQDIISKHDALESIGSVKDLVRVSANKYALATNVEALMINVNSQGFFGKKTLYKGRTYALAFDNAQNTFYIACAKGLVKIDSSFKEEYINYNNNPLMINDISYVENRLFLGTKKNGLMTLSDDKPIPFINTTDDLLSNSIDQFKVLDDKIYIASEGGFQVFNLKGELIKSLSVSDGLMSSKVRDFIVDKDYLWLLHQHGLQRIPITELFSNATAYTSQISEVQFYNNDQLVADQRLRFSYNQNRVQFKVIAPSLERQQDITYEYRLTGIDNSWNINKYDQSSIEYKSLPPDDYVFEVILKYKNTEQDRHTVMFSIAKPPWQQWWFITLMSFTFLAITYWFYSRRLRQQEIKAKQINELNASKLTAIQSQMNPHFIFNALNSIQEYIVLSEKKLATKYLGMFADLMRIYLRQGKSKGVLLSEEIEALKLYLELEKMRFEDSLSYSINVDKTISADEQLIPSLLIQPYIENALKHGLLHKETDKRLTISFHHDDENRVLNCQIIDNGVGRIKSLEINKMRNPNHKSFASSATRKRLELLNHNSTRAIGVQIIDLYDEHNLPCGTQVQLSIPTERHKN